MGYHRILSRWTPHALTYHDRAVRVSIAESLLLHPHRKDFLNLIVTGDESWIYHGNITRYAYWIYPDAKPPSQPKVDPHGDKIMLFVFRESQGALFCELLKEFERVSINAYME